MAEVQQGRRPIFWMQWSECNESYFATSSDTKPPLLPHGVSCPAEVTLTRLMTPVFRSIKKLSARPLLSSATKSFAEQANARNRLFVEKLASPQTPPDGSPVSQRTDARCGGWGSSANAAMGRSDIVATTEEERRLIEAIGINHLGSCTIVHRKRCDVLK